MESANRQFFANALADARPSQRQSAAIVLGRRPPVNAFRRPAYEVALNLRVVHLFREQLPGANTQGATWRKRLTRLSTQPKHLVARVLVVD